MNKKKQLLLVDMEDDFDEDLSNLPPIRVQGRRSFMEIHQKHIAQRSKEEIEQTRRVRREREEQNRRNLKGERG